MNYNEQKATAVACCFLEQAGGELEDLKLMKLMYLSEREMIRRANVSITGDGFFSMQNGPVLSETLRLMQGNPRKVAGDIWNEHIEIPAQWKVKLKKRIELSSLSQAEQEILLEQWHSHGKKNKWKLVDLTHTFPEWDKRASQFKTSIPIPFVDVLQAMDIPSKAIEARLAQLKAADYFEDLLSQAEAGLLESR